MATTTPNFGWSVPTSTDLVKDGATAIETLGDSIDASLVDLKGGTTGQVLAKNSNTDMDFVWSNDAAGMTNPMTTTGDTIYSSSGSTPARLGIGTTGQVLTVAGGVPSWSTPAGGAGLTLISTGAISAASSWNLPTDSFTATYTNYRLLLTGKASGYGTASFIDMFLRASGTNNTTADYYYSFDGRTFNGATITGNNNGSTFIRLGGSSQMINNFDLVITQPKASATTAVFGTGMVAATSGDPGLFSGNLSVAGHFGGTNSFDSLGFQIGTYTFTGNYYLYGLAN